MATSTPHQLLLVADHLKLSLLERQRAKSLSLPSSTAKDAQITRSLSSFSESLAALEASSDDTPSDDLPRLRKQYNELYAQFHGTAPPSDDAAHPNNPELERDFAAAQRRPGGKAGSKNVRFRDDPTAEDEDEDANRAALFSSQQQQSYTDEPGVAAQQEQQGMDNQQIHAYHSRVLREQDEQLDVLGQSVGRQRMLGIQMGDEIDEQNEMLGDVERGVDRHGGTLDAAQRRLGRIARKGREGWNSWITIAILVVVLVLLIVVLK